ncbi:MAG TPA: DUF4105 domain-containing protein [Pseudomonas sabulinigri]|uniref:Lnb N-terminal periplasmic domain-containing protein n=1 Tax=marine sediment metagenome TaxID=412755 RepID=A0A0F9XQM1_9ZZZZ|nr:DUF4105 domain-containing protein [Halopseudomonas sabulinigri]HEC50518.1 DUF4105 domain-containing protein [Halopseudomonas sabulinigri]
MLLGLSILLLFLGSVWVLLAMWFHRPDSKRLRYMPIASWSLWLVVVLFLAAIGRYPPALGLILFAVILIVLWWRGLRAQGISDWADDMAMTTTGRIVGERLELQQVRNFNWRSETDYDVRWDERVYDLAKLQTVDMISSYWGPRAIAHILVSFGFEDGRYLTFSVEIRRARTEEFSALGGFFKHFELNIVASDEHDIVRVRTNIRHEDAYLYRTRLSADDGRELLEAYVAAANELAARPRYYHTLTANCTTVVFRLLRRIHPNLPLDYRLWLSGYLDEYVYALDGLQPNYSMTELRQRGRITQRARQVCDGDDFSHCIRDGVPGYDHSPGPVGQ